MIIDSHVHFGRMGRFDLHGSDLIHAMDKYRVEIGVVSNLEGAEFDSELNLIDGESRVPQTEVNARTLAFVERHPTRLKGLFWIKPHTEGYSDDVKDFLLQHREHFAGLKAHPYHSKLRLTEGQYQPYIELAEENHLTFVVHTAKDEYSRTRHVHDVAADYPDVDFVMVHMGMYSDHREAAEYMADLPNLFGDTTWVNTAAVLEAVDICGSEKILFGTDAIVEGIDTYARYEGLLTAVSAQLDGEGAEDLLWRNAARLFEIGL